MSTSPEIGYVLDDSEASLVIAWHECADGKTMQLVPTAIHDACRHSGGVSTMRTVGAYGDVRLRD